MGFAAKEKKQLVNNITEKYDKTRRLLYYPMISEYNNSLLSETLYTSIAPIVRKVEIDEDHFYLYVKQESNYQTEQLEKISLEYEVFNYGKLEDKIRVVKVPIINKDAKDKFIRGEYSTMFNKAHVEKIFSSSKLNFGEDENAFRFRKAKYILTHNQEYQYLIEKELSLEKNYLDHIELEEKPTDFLFKK